MAPSGPGVCVQFAPQGDTDDTRETEDGRMRAQVQLSYAIGAAKPLPLFLETYGTEQSKLTAEDFTNVLKMEFNYRPGVNAGMPTLREPMYQETAAYCHFGRVHCTEVGKKYFEWEYAKDVKKCASLGAVEVATALKACNYMTYGIGVAKPLPPLHETYGTEQGKLTAEDVNNVLKMDTKKYASTGSAESAATPNACNYLSYAIGDEKQLPLILETYGTEQDTLTAEDFTNVLKKEFDCRPGAIAVTLALRETKYQETSAYCSLDREAYTKDRTEALAGQAS